MWRTISRRDDPMFQIQLQRSVTKFDERFAQTPSVRLLLIVGEVERRLHVVRHDSVEIFEVVSTDAVFTALRALDLEMSDLIV